MMKIKKNDKVLVILGKDRGKKSKISQVFPHERKIVVENVNKHFRHVRAKREGQKGQRIEYYAKMNVSNVMFLCPKCNKAARLGSKLLDNGKKVRVCRKCDEVV